MKMILLACGLLLALSLVIIGGMWLSFNTREVGLRNQIVAQQKSNEASFDAVWKIIAQKAQVTDSYKEGFREVYKDIMAGRYGTEKNSPLMKWVWESTPQFSDKLYVDLSTTIESQRITFKRDQQKLIDLKREHDNLRTQPVSKLFVGSRPEVAIVVVTSQKTDETFTSGHEDDVSLPIKH